MHNDLKGGNILVSEDGTARICDFEMSVDLSGTLSRSMGGLGTVGFMAPEVLAWARAGFPKDSEREKLRQDGQPDAWAKPSAASDMYSFGVVALNMLCPPAPERYPETNPSVINDTDHPGDLVAGCKRWVTALLAEQPSLRPTAVNLHAEPFFAMNWDEMADRRAQEAEAAAAQRVAEAEEQIRVVREEEQRAKSDAAAAEKKMQDAAVAVAEARAVEQKAHARQAAAARKQISRAQIAEQQAIADADAARQKQRQADEQLVKAMQTQSAAQAAQERIKRDKASLLAPLRAQTRPLARGSAVWAEIEARVQSSLPQHVITSLEQIDNNELLVDFNRQKEIVAAKPANAARRGGSLDQNANVHRAFHAMAGGPEELKKIYMAGRGDGGFDFRLGRLGAYGRGSYFAEHAIYPAYLYPRPEQAPDGSIVMLVADVILGQSKDLGTACEPSLVREPPIEGASPGEVWDSVQGTENGFGIHRVGPQRPVDHPRPDARRYGLIAGGTEEYGRQYVVFEKAKAYPRYLLTIRPQ